MFFDGYIGAPPTMTVFSAAKLAVPVVRPNASASAAALAHASVERCFMVQTPGSVGVSLGRRHCELRSQALRRCARRDHRAVSLPKPITGPVGAPVGEPPSGSSDTASVAPAEVCGRSARGMAMLTGLSALKSPTGNGLPPAGISHS